MGIARFLSIPTCTFSVTKIDNVGSSGTRSELVRDDGWRKRACLVPGRRRRLCSCCGSAGTACWEWQSKTNSWWHGSPLCTRVFQELQRRCRENWAFAIPRSYRSSLIPICYPLAFSCHANDYGHFRFVHTNFFFERVLWMVLPLLTCSHHNTFLNSPTLASIARFFQTCDTNSILILERAGSYSNTSKRCNLCFAGGISQPFRWQTRITEQKGLKWCQHAATNGSF